MTGCIPLRFVHFRVWFKYWRRCTQLSHAKVPSFKRNHPFLTPAPKHGCIEVRRLNCSPAFVHTTWAVLQVAKAAGYFTAWTDKHLVYDLVNGPSGTVRCLCPSSPLLADLLTQFQHPRTRSWFRKPPARLVQANSATLPLRMPSPPRFRAAVY